MKRSPARCILSVVVNPFNPGLTPSPQYHGNVDCDSWHVLGRREEDRLYQSRDGHGRHYLAQEAVHGGGRGDDPPGPNAITTINVMRSDGVSVRRQRCRDDRNKMACKIRTTGLLKGEMLQDVVMTLLGRAHD
jgi:hypothetical protein